MTDHLLEMRGISKAFPGVQALSDVSLSIRHGETHALMGENGAGKSTLIKVLTGIHHHDAGEILFDGAPIHPEAVARSTRPAISAIYQELNLAPYLSVGENIFLGREPRRLGLIDWRTIERRSREILADMGLDEIDVTRPLREYSAAVRQMVAIARALCVEAKLLVMDEPTSSLSEKEVAVLFGVIERLRDRNISTLFISHKMDEIFAICDRATILRDGQLVGEYPIRDLTKLKLVSLMIGRDATAVLEERRPQSRQTLQAPVVLRATAVTGPRPTKEISVDIHSGEILGVAGLLGSGRTELAKILFAEEPHSEGQIEIQGKIARMKGPRDAIRLGVGFCGENRKEEGIFPNMSVLDNITMATLPELSAAGVLSRTAQRRVAERYIEKLNIATSGPNQRMCELSGGNQQKVLLARWLCKHPLLMILDEPTRGIDVGARSEIEDLIAELADGGVAVLMISSEMEELIRSCDRIAVLREGRKVGELAAGEISEDALLHRIAHGRDGSDNAHEA